METNLAFLIDLLACYHPIIYQSPILEEAGQFALKFQLEQIHIFYRSEQPRAFDANHINIYLNDSKSESIPVDIHATTILIDASPGKELVERIIRVGMFYEHYLSVTLMNMMDQIYSGVDFETILSLLTEKVVNPLAVYNRQGVIIMNSDTKNEISLPTKLSFLPNKALTDDSAKTAACFNEHVISHSIWISGVCWGFLVMYDYDRPFMKNDFQFLECLALILDLYINRSFQPKPRTMPAWEQYLSYLLERPGNPSNLPAPPVVFPKIMYVIALRLETPHLAISTGIHKKCSLYFRNSYMLEKDNILLLLVDGNQLAVEQQNNFFSFEEFLAKDHLLAAISNPFEDIKYFGKYYRQALIATESNLSYKKPLRVIEYSNCIIQYMINICEREIDITELYHPAYLLLDDYDKQYGTSYRAFLDTYILHLGNMSECAQNEGVHYNTIKYRVRKIQDITGIQINNKKIFSQLYVSSLLHSRSNYT